MWTSLTDPVHLEHYQAIYGEDWSPMLRIVETLTQKEYAATLFAFTSHDYFCITTAPDYNRSHGCDMVTIAFNPRTKLFRVTYGGRRDQAKYMCEEMEVISLIDSLVLRLILMTPQEAASFSSPR